MSVELPLSGTIVYEFGGNLAAPYATWILAELGATVIKIERAEGDDARGWGPPFWQEASLTFQAVNRNKQSVALDLRDPAKVADLRRRIAAEADVVVQNMRPGALAELGLSADLLMADNPRLIYCSLGAFGDRGPLKDSPGYDSLLQAFAGVMSVTGEEGGEPSRAGVPIIDMGSGLWCAVGIMAALLRRATTGEGGRVDASLFETALGFMTAHAARYLADGKLPIRRASSTGGVVPYQGYACTDGTLIIGVLNDRLFVKLAKALGHPEWSDDERFGKNAARVTNREALNALIEPLMAAAPRSHWQQLLERAGVPCAAVQTIDEVLVHEQTQAVDIAQPTSDPAMKLFGLPIRIDGQRPPLRTTAPGIGQDTESWRERTSE